jgi:hypothetical protein
LELFDPQLLINDPDISPLLRENEAEILASALKVAFFASLHVNEGRPLEFALAIYSGGGIFFDRANLRAPEPLTGENLKFLSAAIDSDERCFVVTPDNKDQLHIHAISQTPYRSILAGVRLPPLIVVDGPGRVALIINDKHLLYDRGLVRKENEDVLRKWTADIKEIIVTHVSTPTQRGQALRLGMKDVYTYDPRQWNLHAQVFRKHASEYASLLVSEMLRLIAKFVKRAPHGGALLIIPNGANLQDIATDGRWFRDSHSDLQDPAFRSVALRAHFALALEGKWVVDDLREEFQKDPSRWARDVINVRFSDALRSIESACRRCAQLTQVDGATVLRSDLDVLGFGVRLKALNPESLPPAYKEFLTSRGQRHSSMAYTVTSVDNAIGIVISQDGNVVAFHKPVGMPAELQELIV